MKIKKSLTARAWIMLLLLAALLAGSCASSKNTYTPRNYPTNKKLKCG